MRFKLHNKKGGRPSCHPFVESASVCEAYAPARAALASGSVGRVSTICPKYSR
jgi:hypothetical protein